MFSKTIVQKLTDILKGYFFPYKLYSILLLMLMPRHQPTFCATFSLNGAPIGRHLLFYSLVGRHSHSLPSPLPLLYYIRLSTLFPFIFHPLPIHSVSFCEISLRISKLHPCKSYAKSSCMWAISETKVRLRTKATMSRPIIPAPSGFGHFVEHKLTPLFGRNRLRPSSE